MRVNPNNEQYEQVTVFDQPALFTSLRLLREELPKGVYAYDVRHSDDGFDAAEIKDFIMVNHMGTIITKEPIAMDEHGSRVIENEEDFTFGDNSEVTLKQFMNGINREDIMSEQNKNDGLKLPNKCKLLSEYDNHVLAERNFNVGETKRTEYITWRKSDYGGVTLGHYYNDLEAAKEDFAVRSDLVSKDRLFSKDETAILYAALDAYEESEYMDYDNKSLCNNIETAREKLESGKDSFKVAVDELLKNYNTEHIDGKSKSKDIESI